MPKTPFRPIPKITPSILSRFTQRHLEPDKDSCWPWTGMIHSTGYGDLSISQDGRDYHYLAHRLSWLINKGVIPDSLCVLHKCDNRICVNPGHLFLGTQAENLRDMYQKNRRKAACGVRCHKAKLTETKVRKARFMRNQGASYKEIAKKFSVTPQAVYALCKRKSWKQVD